MARCQDRRTASALRMRWMGTGCILLPAPGQARRNPPSHPSSLSLLSPKPSFPPLRYTPVAFSEKSCSTTGSCFGEFYPQESQSVWLLLLQIYPSGQFLASPCQQHRPSQHQQSQRDLTKSSHYLSESRSYLSRFLSGESICWNFSLRSFPLSLYLPFITERTK